MSGGDIPDAIGYRFAGHFDGTVVVEAKTSRADYLADRHKAATLLARWNTQDEALSWRQDSARSPSSP